MPNNEEFEFDDFEFDFEKEFGVNLDALLNDDVSASPKAEPAPQPPAEEPEDVLPDEGEEPEDFDEDVDLAFDFDEEILDDPEPASFTAEDFDAEEFGDDCVPDITLDVDGEEDPDMELDFHVAFDKPAPVEEPVAPPKQEAFDFPEELDLSQEPGFSELPQSDAAPAEKPAEKPAAPVRPRTRRRRPSKTRMFKDVYLPLIITGAAAILTLTFIIGAIVRAVGGSGETTLNDPTDPSQSAAQLLQIEAEGLLKQAEALAAGYDYQGALEVLESFSGDIANNTALRDKRAEYTTAKEQLKAWNDPASIPNLSFHVLIADPARAFADEEYKNAYKKNFVTTDEFSKILEQLYANGYVLVDLDSFIQENTASDGITTYDTKPIYLPDGKKPIMLTETMVNYFYYMVDKDRDGQPNADGGGFASRLIVDAKGEITCEMVDASGNTVTGDFDFVPILNRFIKSHPDFSYQGARATLAVSGMEGVFGYRTMPSIKEDKGQDYYNEQVSGAKKIAQALRDQGYTIACYTYDNIDYNKTSATGIQSDLELWEKEVEPVLGKIDVMVYARGSDITTGGGYSGTKYNVLKKMGYRYFMGAANVPWAEVTKDYVRQSRLMVVGENLAGSAGVYASYFDAKTVLNDQRNTTN